jgi:hypothetical protein
LKKQKEFITEKPDLWRLLDVRYNLMENLIYSQSNDIIELILESTEVSTKCNQKLHIPQLYDWNGHKKSKHELLIALKNNNITINSNNAIDNTGWLL